MSRIGYGLVALMLSLAVTASARFPRPQVVDDSITAHRVQLSWQQQSAVAEYRLRLFQSDCSIRIKTYQVAASKSKKRLKQLTADTTYCVKMRAIFKDGSHDRWSKRRKFTTVSAASSVPVIYVTLTTHNEEPGSRGTPNFSTDEPAFWEYHDAVLDFAEQITAAGATYNWQSEWNYLLGEQAYDTGTADTAGKNLVAYLHDNLGVEIDPHSHEHLGYNYADVAYLIQQLGVEPTHVVGGYIAEPASSAKVEYFWEPLTSNLDSSYTWQAEILWGGASSNHQTDYEVSGVWRPTDNDHFLEHSNTALLPNVGGYQDGWDGLDDLLTKQAAGELTIGAMYTANIMVNQDELLDEDTINSTVFEIEDHADEVATGKMQWVTIEEAETIWEEDFNSQPNIYQAD